MPTARLFIFVLVEPLNQEYEKGGKEPVVLTDIIPSFPPPLQLTLVTVGVATILGDITFI